MSAEVLELRGDIDLNEKPKVAAQLEPLIERQITGIVIDLSQVPYVDSSGLAIFIDALQRVQQYSSSRFPGWTKSFRSLTTHNRRWQR
jgi:anti-anti-sigma factor